MKHLETNPIFTRDGHHILEKVINKFQWRSVTNTIQDNKSLPVGLFRFNNSSSNDNDESVGNKKVICFIHMNCARAIMDTTTTSTNSNGPQQFTLFLRHVITNLKKDLIEENMIQENELHELQSQNNPEVLNKHLLPGLHYFHDDKAIVKYITRFPIPFQDDKEFKQTLLAYKWSCHEKYDSWNVSDELQARYMEIKLNRK